jgi:hypothetical protein
MANDIKVKIGGDTTDLNNKLKGMKAGIANVAKKLAVAGVAGIAAFGAIVKRTIKAGDEIGKAAKRIGISAEAWQKYTFAARRAGAASEDIEKSFKRMQKNINDADRGLTTAKDSLEAVGLSFEALKGLRPEKQFEMITDRLSDIQDSSKKAAIAQDLFGRAGTKIIPMLENYRELGEELESINGVMSDESVEAAERYTDAIENLSTAIQTMTGDSGVIEWLAKVAEGIDAILTNSERFKKAGGREAFFDIKTGKEITKQEAGQRQIQETFGGSGQSFEKKTIFDVTEKEKKVLAEFKKEKEKFGGKKKKEIDEEKAAKLAALNGERAAREKAAEELKKQKEELSKFEKQQEDAATASTRAVSETTKAIKEQLILEEMRRAGLLKEAFIREKLTEASQRAKRALTLEEELAISSAAGELFKTQKEKEATQFMGADIQSDRLRRIGGTLGGVNENLNKERNKLMADQLKSLIKIEEGLTREQDNKGMLI